MNRQQDSADIASALRRRILDGFKIRWPQGRAGSSPAVGIFDKERVTARILRESRKARIAKKPYFTPSFAQKTAPNLPRVICGFFHLASDN